MKIGLCGSMSVGKTTLVKELAKLEQFKNYHITTERSKYLRDLGIPLNTDSTIKGQMIFAAERATELFHSHLLTDRTIYDVCAFTLSAKSIEWYQKRELIEAFLNLRHEYDLIIYVSPDGVEIEDNGVRTIDVDYRKKIDTVIKEMLGWYPPKKLISISGTTENRISSILQNL
jgi:nicotinamide riboside kinase